MKEILLTTLRNKETSIHEFRIAAEQLGLILASEVASMLPKKTIPINTPLTKTTGEVFANHIVLVPILRSGILLLNSFMHFFSRASVGFVGIRRDEQTALPHMYYAKLPITSTDDSIIILDPMIATGGSATQALTLLKKHGIQESNITFAAIIGSREGVEHLKKNFPAMKMVVVHVDAELNAQKYIVPGLGDFGDRYFGTEQSVQW